MVLTVKQARLLAGKSQKEIASALGICRDTYSKIERNPDLATIRQAKTISKITGIPYDQIFFGDDSTFSGDSAA